MTKFTDKIVQSITKIDQDYYVIKVPFSTKVGVNTITYNDESYRVVSLYGSFIDDAKFILCKLISTHSNTNEEPKKIIIEDYYYQCPSCGFHLESMTSTRIRCPQCDQILIK